MAWGSGGGQAADISDESSPFFDWKSSEAMGGRNFNNMKFYFLERFTRHDSVFVISLASRFLKTVKFIVELELNLFIAVTPTPYLAV